MSKKKKCLIKKKKKTNKQTNKHSTMYSPGNQKKKGLKKKDNNNNKCLKRSKSPGKQAGKKKKNQDNWTKLVQRAILSFTHKTPPTMFSLHFGETSFPSYQITPFSIFFPIFSPKFSIHLISPPNKHTLTVIHWKAPTYNTT